MKNNEFTALAGFETDENFRSVMEWMWSGVIIFALRGGFPLAGGE